MVGGAFALFENVFFVIYTSIMTFLFATRSVQNWAFITITVKVRWGMCVTGVSM